MEVTINWHGFVDIAERNYPKESCAFLFAERPFSGSEVWHVLPVDNVSDDPLNRWEPDKKQMQQVKKNARVSGWTKIGNIHSHPIQVVDFALKRELTKKGFEVLDGQKLYDEVGHPSDVDLKFAKKFNDIIRAILIIDKTSLRHIYWHDQYGRRVDISSTSINMITRDGTL